MRSFMILCFAAIAIAAPEYNYERPLGLPLMNIVVDGGQVEEGSNIQLITIGGQDNIQENIVGSDLGSEASIGIGSIATENGGQASSINVLPEVIKTSYNKVFYVHAAPEEQLDEAAHENPALTTTKNIRVVFIQTPENKGLQSAAVQLAKSVAEDKTAIYVLNKQTDLGELRDQLVEIKEKTEKPEVHFIKYKTPQEAVYAQQSIQAAYNQLSGPSQIVNAGAVPVQNFVGALYRQPAAVQAAATQQTIAAGSEKNLAAATYASQQNYLPPSTAYLPTA